MTSSPSWLLTDCESVLWSFTPSRSQLLARWHARATACVAASLCVVAAALAVAVEWSAVFLVAEAVLLVQAGWAVAMLFYSTRGVVYRLTNLRAVVEVDGRVVSMPYRFMDRVVVGDDDASYRAAAARPIVTQWRDVHNADQLLEFLIHPLLVRLQRWRTGYSSIASSESEFGDAPGSASPSDLSPSTASPQQQQRQQHLERSEHKEVEDYDLLARLDADLAANDFGGVSTPRLAAELKQQSAESDRARGHELAGRELHGPGCVRFSSVSNPLWNGGNDAFAFAHVPDAQDVLERVNRYKRQAALTAPQGVRAFADQLLSSASGGVVHASLSGRRENQDEEEEDAVVDRLMRESAMGQMDDYELDEIKVDSLQLDRPLRQQQHQHQQQRPQRQRQHRRPADASLATENVVRMYRSASRRTAMTSVIALFVVSFVVGAATDWFTGVVAFLAIWFVLFIVHQRQHNVDEVVVTRSGMHLAFGGAHNEPEFVPFQDCFPLVCRTTTTKQTVVAQTIEWFKVKANAHVAVGDGVRVDHVLLTLALVSDPFPYGSRSYSRKLTPGMRVLMVIGGVIAVVGFFFSAL